jgi:hypothetical protein
MGFSIHEASAPVFVRAMSLIPRWLDKALAEGQSEAELMRACLTADMRPLPAQIQMASDSAKMAVARLSGQPAPAMPDTEATFDELKARCRATVAFIESVPEAAFEGAEERAVELRFPNGMGYRFIGREYLTGFALPNFFFHVTTTYALLRAAGVQLGKPDFLAYLGQPVQL